MFKLGHYYRHTGLHVDSNPAYAGLVFVVMSIRTSYMVRGEIVYVPKPHILFKSGSPIHRGSVWYAGEPNFYEELTEEEGLIYKISN